MTSSTLHCGQEKPAGEPPTEGLLGGHPVGTGLGAAIGAVTGGLAGKAIGDAIDTSAEEGLLAIGSGPTMPSDVVTHIVDSRSPQVPLAQA